ncbi:MAG: hypothetical protein ACJ759_16045 [Thermoanaerobaculia bacterium]
MKKLSSIFMGVIAVLAIGGPAAWAGAARMSVDPGRVQWDAQVEYERAVLTVSMPGGEVVRQEFDATQTPVFELAAGAKDGAYTYELRLVPRIDASLRKSLAEARKSGDEAAIAKLRAELPESSVVSGAFMVQAGTIVTPEGTEPQGKKGPKAATSAGSVGVITAADQVIPDDLIVQGSECVGFDCVNNESFGFDTIRLKENSTRIKFEDTSTGSFPSNDWQLTANDSASGGANKFSIEDITGSKVPFTITAGAATNSIFVDSTGRLGLRTSTPVLDVHISTSNTPAIRLEQTNAGGFTAQTWDIAGNEANFFVRDVTGGSRLPFRIRPGAPTSSIDISADGDVGIGTASPDFQLHVSSDAAEDAVVGLGPDPGGTTGFNFGYGGFSFSGDAFLNAKGTVSGNHPSLRFLTNTTDRMIVTSTGSVGIGTTSPSARLHVSGGNIQVTGGSFVDDGVTLSAPDYVFEPGYELMPLAELDAFVKENRHLPGVPSASDIKQKGLNLSQFQMKLLEKVEELTLHMLAQKKEVDELRAANAALAAKLQEAAGSPSN